MLRSTRSSVRGVYWVASSEELCGEMMRFGQRRQRRQAVDEPGAGTPLQPGTPA